MLMVTLGVLMVVVVFTHIMEIHGVKLMDLLKISVLVPIMMFGVPIPMIMFTT